MLNSTKIDCKHVNGVLRACQFDDNICSSVKVSFSVGVSLIRVAVGVILETRLTGSAYYWAIHNSGFMMVGCSKESVCGLIERITLVLSL